jgi:hypothetical protein
MVQYLGSGFGSSFISESGAIRYLSGDEAVRQAHNFLFTWLGYVGILGAVLGAIGLAIFGWTLKGGRGKAEAFGLSAYAGIVLLGLLGVVVESPFGYEIIFMALLIAQAAKRNQTHQDARDPDPGTFGRGHVSKGTMW